MSHASGSYAVARWLGLTRIPTAASTMDRQVYLLRMFIVILRQQLPARHTHEKYT